MIVEFKNEYGTIKFKVDDSFDNQSDKGNPALTSLSWYSETKRKNSKGQTIMKPFRIPRKLKKKLKWKV